MINWPAYICASRWRPESALFYSGSSTQVPLRYFYRGGLKQTGACSSLNAEEGEREKNTKPIKQWSTVSEAARLLIGERGCTVCESKRCGQFNALETRRDIKSH